MATVSENRRRAVDLLRRFGRDRHGTTAFEFAIVGTAFLGLMLFVIALGFQLYVEVALNFASSRAARLLAVDSTQTRSSNSATFQAVTYCPLLSAFLSCANVTISLQPVTNYLNASTTSGTALPFFPGQGGSLMLLRATYRLPSLSWPDPSGAGGSSFAGATVTVGYPYQNEY